MFFCLKRMLFCSSVLLRRALLICPFVLLSKNTPAQDFIAMEIPDSVWLRMQGKTYVENPHITRADLRYLRVLHWDYDNRSHQGELVCNKLIADKLIAIFRELYAHHYPIQRIRLADDYDADDERQMSDNNTSCFCYRHVPDTKKLSYHARGLAIDINPFENPYVRPSRVRPAGAAAYADRSKDFPHKIDKEDLCYRLFRAHGFSWGGSWRSVQDYQHFEK